MTPYDLVLVPFPFTDLSASKQRPAMILATVAAPRHRPHFVIAMVTSQVEGNSFPGDVHFTDWRGAGLPKPSLLRLAKVVTIDGGLVRKKLGRVAAGDQSLVRRRFAELFGPLMRGPAS